MKQRILVVDDEPAFTWIVRLHLEQTGLYDVRVENEGKLAHAAAREFHPDLILLDVLMPGILGPQIAAQLEDDPELKSAKIAFVTAVMSKKDEQKFGSHFSGHRFISKPFSAAQLSQFVESELRR